MENQLISDILCSVKEKMKEFFFLKTETYDKDTIDSKDSVLSNAINEKSTVTFTRKLNSGTEIGTLNIKTGSNTNSTKLYCETNTDSTYFPADATPLADATFGKPGTSIKYAREDHVHPTDKSKVSFSSSLSSGTKIGTITINDVSTDLHCETNTDTIYTHPSTHSTDMIKDSNMHSNIGSIQNATQSDINTKIDTKLGTKVDKSGNKVLSDNNYTTAEKDKLAGLENYTHPETHSTNIIKDPNAHSIIGSSANATQTDINTKIDSKLDTKVNKDGNKVLSTHDYTDADKRKLDSLNNYEHPNYIPQSYNSGIYKIAINNTGHIISAETVPEASINNNGLMSISSFKLLTDVHSDLNTVSKVRLHSTTTLVRKGNIVQLTIDGWNVAGQNGFLNGRYNTWVSAHKIPTANDSNSNGVNFTPISLMGDAHCIYCNNSALRKF